MSPAAVGAAVVTGLQAITGGAISAYTASGIYATTVYVTQAAMYAGAAYATGKALAPDIKSFKAGSEGMQVMSRDSAPVRTVVYGQAVVSGAMVYLETTGPSKEYLHLIIPVAGHEIQSFETIWIGDRLSTVSRFTQGSPDSLKINEHLGTSGQAADATLNAASNKWTDNHKLSGVAYLYVRLYWGVETYPGGGSVWTSGIPNIKALIKGKKIYDPRTTTTAWSENPALCIRDYLTDTTYGMGIPTAELDDDTFNDAADICEESVNVPDGAGGVTTQDRYTCNGVFETSETPMNIIEKLLTSCSGNLIFVQGKYKLYAGAYVEPTVTLTESDLEGEIKVSPRFNRKELFNAVRGIYINSDNKWKATDFPPVTNPTYETQDGSVQIMRDIELPYTINSYEAQRLAKIHLEKSRQGITVEFPAKFTALQLAPMDTVMLEIDQLGWSSKIFRVLTMGMSAQGGVDLVLQEEASASYDWNSGNATEIDPAPDTELADPWEVLPPVNLSATESLYETVGSQGLKIKVLLSWDAADAFTIEYVVEYKKTSDSDYIPAPTPKHTLTETTIFDLEPATYVFRVAAISSLGVRSEEYTSVTTQIYGLSANPVDVTNFNLVAVSDGAYLSWDRATDLDVINGGYVKIRHSPKTTGASWTDGVEFAKLAGTATEATLPLASGTYMAKFIDSGGNESTNAVLIVTTAPSVLNMTAAATQTESTGFAGNKVGTAVHDSELHLDGGSCVEFDGATEEISIANHASLNGYTDQLSIEMWVKPVDPTPASAETLFNRDDKYKVYISTSGAVLFRTETSSGTKIAASFDGFSGSDEWHHVVCVYNGTDSRIYIDGVLAMTPNVQTGNIDATTAILYVGSGGGAVHFNGKIDDFRIYHRELSAAEVADRYNPGKYDDESGLVCRLSLNENTGTNADDVSANSNVGTLSASSMWAVGRGHSWALNFVSADSVQALIVNHSSLNAYTDEMTVELWANFEDLSPGAETYLFYRSNMATIIENTDGTISYAVRVGADWKLTTTGWVIPATGVWHHIMGVYDGVDIRIYIDGVLDEGSVLAQTGNVDASTSTIYLGSAAGSNYFDGGIGNIRLIYRALSAAQVMEHYNMLHYNVDGLVMFLPCSEGGEGTAFDGSLNTNDAILSADELWRRQEDIPQEGFYQFNSIIDLTEKYTSRVRVHIDSYNSDGGDTIDARQDQIDSWPDFDSSIGVTDVDATSYISLTDDDPTGSPVFTPFTPLIVADYAARAYAFKVILRSQTPGHDINITTLSATVDMPDRVEADLNIASGASPKAVTFTDAFKATPAIGITADDMATGDYFVLTSKSRTGFTVEFKNSGGSSVDRTFDWIAKGYGKETT